MTLAEISTRITFLTQQNTNAFSAANRALLINNAVDDIQISILQSMDDWNFDDYAAGNINQWPKTYNLAANTQTVDIDVVTNKILRVDRVEVSYDGTNWYKATAFNIGESLESVNTTKVNSDFSTSSPYYALVGETVYLFPIPTSAVTGGLRVWFTRSMTSYSSSDLTTGTAVPGFDTQFHELVPLKVAYDWVCANSPDNQAKAGMLMNKIMMMEDKMKKHYGYKNSNRKINLKTSSQDYS
ncbi:hypothetical protein M0R04_12860 [Candidatus Dojkabacteria bacterium]|jgi:hypothetical protein|nr:hypothetical protein [Candidatus Dojkabacteria bacterium]